MKVIAIAALLLGTTAGDAAEPPLAPSGKWAVEYADNLCVLSRDYATDKSKITFGVRPWPMGDSVEIVLMRPGSYGTGIKNGKATITLQPSSGSIAGTYSAYYVAKSKVRIETVSIPQAALAALGGSSAIDISMSAKAPVSLALVNMNGALSALAKCTDDLLREWHIDPTERLRIGTMPQPIGALTDWIGSDDYPDDSISRGSHGTVTIAWTIDTDGKVQKCGVAATSGDPALDTAACAAITKHGRYKPALDKDGKPMAVHSTRRVVWQPVEAN